MRRKKFVCEVVYSHLYSTVALPFVCHLAYSYAHNFSFALALSVLFLKFLYSLVSSSYILIHLYIFYISLYSLVLPHAPMHIHICIRNKYYMVEI